MNRIEILAHYYPLEDILEQNDIEPEVIIKFLVEEGYIDLEDYFFDNEVVDD